MSDVEWRGLSVPDSTAMSAARRQALNAAQWLARVTNSYAAANGQAPLRWNSDGEIVTPEFHQSLSLELNLPELSISFRENGKPIPHRLQVDDRSPAQVEAWLLVEMLHHNMDREQFSLRLPYELPNLMTGDAQEYEAEPYRAELSALTNLYKAAGRALKRAAGAAGGTSPEIACLPHNLHLVVDGHGSSGHFGFSPGDESTDSPYFYVAKEGSSAAQPQAKLPLAQVVESEDPDAMIDAFFASSSDAGQPRH